ncbi:hypothetical protein BDP27DRAFT_294947 [Rhodocollybia butyracea]|uniref:Uncharacterized protein n=1 Tax=Rhodocollybia butyracea TaxID=206335 RepID=A0A9P5PHP9_9AGAR|nr:hypothetical protein BDP27DRAFT_294947 [Rhodocollybia butyracea]
MSSFSTSRICGPRFADVVGRTRSRNRSSASRPISFFCAIICLAGGLSLLLLYTRCFLFPSRSIHGKMCPWPLHADPGSVMELATDMLPTLGDITDRKETRLSEREMTFVITLAIDHWISSHYRHSPTAPVSPVRFNSAFCSSNTRHLAHLHHLLPVPLPVIVLNRQQNISVFDASSTQTFAVRNPETFCLYNFVESQTSTFELLELKSTPTISLDLVLSTRPKSLFVLALVSPRLTGHPAKTRPEFGWGWRTWLQRYGQSMGVHDEQGSCTCFVLNGLISGICIDE